MEKNFFVKSHGLGNEYVVIDLDNIDFEINRQSIARICDRHLGIGADGLVVGSTSIKADFGFRVFNPDGREAEKSGNGLRIFSKFLYDYGYTANQHFSIETLTDTVQATVTAEEHGKARIITVDMGKAIFSTENIPVASDLPEFIDQKITLADREYRGSCVSVGNPHCVIFKESLDSAEIKKYGPLIEQHSLFPNGVNIQFVQVLSRSNARIIIWERGAGYTLASGSSSCAVAAVLSKMGLVDSEINVHMSNGSLKIRVDDNKHIEMSGEVREIVRGVFSSEFITDLVYRQCG